MLQGLDCQIHLGQAQDMLWQSIKWSHLLAANKYCLRACDTLQTTTTQWICCLHLHSRRMKELKVRESSSWLLQIRHFDAWSSVADYISGSRGLHIGYAYDFICPFFCGVFKYNWQNLKFINKLKGHLPWHACAGTEGWRQWSALRPGRIIPEEDPVPTFISRYRNFTCWILWTWNLVCHITTHIDDGGGSTLRKTLAPER